MKVSIDKGTYEAFVSPINPKPNKNSYDHFFNGETNVMEYGSEVDTIYIAFGTHNLAHISVIINFSTDDLEEKKVATISPLKEWMAKKEKKKKERAKIYDLYK